MSHWSYFYYLLTPSKTEKDSTAVSSLMYEPGRCYLKNVLLKVLHYCSFDKLE